MHSYRPFLLPILVSLAALGLVYGYLGPEAFATTLLLVVLEITLSFDNAVVNAKVLSRMSRLWQKRFLTWGILIAVIGTRVLLPILIVSASTWVSPITVTLLALFNPEQYGALLSNARHSIAAFGGTFLLLVAFKYFFDVNKGVHWVHWIEVRVSRLGQVQAIEFMIVLVLLLIFSALVPSEAVHILAAGVIGLVLFVAVESIERVFSSPENAARQGIALFLYLNVLDAAFSLDGVVGAFAITNALPAIVVGLGIGAYFVRSLTVYLVRRNTLESLRYIENGAHWAIFGLAISMLASLLIEIPETVTGLIGVCFIGAAIYSSIRYSKTA